MRKVATMMTQRASRPAACWVLVLLLATLGIQGCRSKQAKAPPVSSGGATGTQTGRPPASTQ
jgi:hypothetical protein